MLGVPQAADECDDVEPELVPGEREAALGLGPVRPLVVGATGVAAPADGQVEPGDAGERGEGAAVGVVGR